MRQPTPRVYLRTHQLHRIQRRAQTRRQEWNTFFAAHLQGVKERLEKACAPYDGQRARLHQRSLKQAVEQDADDYTLDSFFNY